MTAATVFKKVAERQNSAAAFNYEREVKQAWRDFPEIKDKIFFIDLCANGLVYPDLSQESKVLAWVNNKSDLSLEIKESCDEEGSGFVPYGPWSSRRSYGFLLLYTAEDGGNLLSEAATKEQEITVAFDHELGHAITPEGWEGKNINFKECIADAYAVIRHLQRYGAASPVVGDCVVNRVYNLLEDRESQMHFTSPVIEQILARRYDIDWKILSPRRTARVAQEFAEAFSPSTYRLNSLAKAFKGINSFGSLAKRVLSTKSDAVFKWGLLMMQQKLDNPKHAGRYKSIRKKLAERQKTLAAKLMEK